MTTYHPVDVHVGRRMHQRRALLGMNQTMLGAAVGLTYQQIQKYERGANRISSSRLWQFAKALDVPVSFFFEDMPASAGRKAGAERSGPFQRDKDPLVKRETLELVRGYYKIEDRRLRKRIFEMVKAMGSATQGNGAGNGAHPAKRTRSAGASRRRTHRLRRS
jgi:transcriptional regulator with XRE-family HTH domain